MNDYQERLSFETIVKMAQDSANNEVWPMVMGEKDPANLLTRDLFTYALILCEANQDLDRVPVLLERAQKMQNLNEESDTYGNFWWNWGQGSVMDTNAAEFSMRGGSLLWLKHQDKLGKGKKTLADMLEPAAHACLHHASMPLYTNITLMNAMNLMILGRALDRKVLIRAGESRFEQFCLYTWDWGIHEFCSPTYTPIQVSCLSMIEHFASSTHIREQAGVMLALFWANVAANWLTQSHYLGGTYSRNTQGFLDGDVNVLELLVANGVLPLSPGTLEPLIPFTLNVIYQAFSEWDAKPIFREVADQPYPHELKQRWGPLQNQTRTFFQFKEVALSITGAQYDYPNYQDVTLAANFNAPVLMGTNPKPKVFTPGKLVFIPDARAKGASAKYSHYTPQLWAATQHKQDALSLVLFRLADLVDLTGLELNLMLSSWPGQIWVGDEKIDPDQEAAWLHLEEKPIFFRQKDSAIGIRIVWQNGGGQPTLQRVEDEQHYAWMVTIDLGLMRGSDSHNTPDTGAAFMGASFWTRIGEGLKTDDDFDDWRDAFTKASSQVSVQPDVECDITVASAGEMGDLQIRAVSLDLTSYEVFLEPKETFTLFGFNDHDYGRQILREMPLVKEYERMLAKLPTVGVPGQLDLAQGYMQFPMTQGYNIPDIPYFWVSSDHGDENGGSDTGSVTWHLSVPAGGRYYLWADVWPCPTDDIVQIFGEGGLPLRKEDQGTNALLLRVYQDVEKPIAVGTSLISCKDTSTWQWTPLAINQAKPPEEPMVVGLPKGDVFLQLFSHTSGLKIRRVAVMNLMGALPE